MAGSLDPPDSLDPVLDALTAHLGDREATRLRDRLDTFSNLPNTIRGVAKWPSDPALERVALAVIDELRQHESMMEWPGQDLWGLLSVAARADDTVLDRALVEPRESDLTKLASIRRATTKHHRELAAPQPVESDAGDLPAKVSEVKRWLVAHPDARAEQFAARPRQKAAERLAAVRALGEIGGAGALEVLRGYASDRHSDAMLAELHRAWSSFDRRQFAAAVFRPNPHTLGLGICATVAGIEAVEGLGSLDVGLTREASLAEVAACTSLTDLRVRAVDLPGFTSVEPLLSLSNLVSLELTGVTRQADLSVLAGLPVERLRIDLDGHDGTFLLDLPRLTRIVISGGSVPDDSRGVIDDIEPRPAHAGLAGVCLALAKRGVQVVTYAYQRSWVGPLLDEAHGDPQVTVVEQAGFVALTNDPNQAAALSTRLRSNLLP
ncbi:hypothetical protein ACSDQ9_13005 [Aestuariimicrobium soli]|uniref:hypothetical protein n=1 Tax=Aestuariimicrobium soli TaxID=2035834 RepID=UPI003EC0A57B